MLALIEIALAINPLGGDVNMTYDESGYIISNFIYNGESWDLNSSYDFEHCFGVIEESYFCWNDSVEYIPNSTIEWFNYNSSLLCDIYEMPFDFYSYVYVVNNSNTEDQAFWDNFIPAMCSTTTTTTSTTITSSTSTTIESTTSTLSGTTSTLGGTTSTLGGTTSTLGGTTSIPGTTLFPYGLPNQNYGTFPSMNGTGGTLPGAGIVNTTGLGESIIGFKTDKLLQWFAIFLALGLLMLRPYILGVSLSAFCVLFFTLIVKWNVFTGSVCLIICFLAGYEWIKEYYSRES
jgi:hypothetical protein